MTDSIGDAIDKLLDRPKWTRKEYSFYEMLVDKVQRYAPGPVRPPHRPSTSLKPVPIKDASADIMDIDNNIREQPWYENSNNQGTIASIFHGMKVLNCKHHTQHGQYQYRLDLQLSNGIKFIVNVVKQSKSRRPDTDTDTDTEYAFRAYYERAGSGTKAHIAAYTPGHSQKSHSLPEYDHLTRMFPTLERHEIVCLAIELIAYYDVDNVIMSLPIGNSYPVTLEQLINGINDRW